MSSQQCQEMVEQYVKNLALASRVSNNDVFLKDFNKNSGLSAVPEDVSVFFTTEIFYKGIKNCFFKKSILDKFFTIRILFEYRSYIFNDYRIWKKEFC